MYEHKKTSLLLINMELIMIIKIDKQKLESEAIVEQYILLIKERMSSFFHDKETKVEYSKTLQD